MKKSELRKIIKEELQRLNEDKKPNKGDVLTITFRNMKWDIEYIDNTHVYMYLTGKRKYPEVYNIEQLKNKPYYYDMQKWMETGKKY